MSYDYLVDHALKNVWCTPEQDLQAIVKPARITPKLGVFGKVSVLWRSHTLPEQGARFHVYQIGQLHPLLMGLFPKSQTWVTMAEACNKQNLIADIYSHKGVQMPRTQVWYMVTADKNLIIAVKEQKLIPFDLTTEDLFVRFYTNAYFHSLRANTINDVVKVVGKVVQNTTEITDIQNQYNDDKAKPGHVYAFVNGFAMSSIDLFTVQPGDVVEYVYDSSIYKVIDFLIGDLQSFPSDMDSKHKFLLHYPGWGSGTIDFHDDIDFFLMTPLATGRLRGMYYHRNQGDAVRMLTHKDYSLPTAYVAGYMTAHNVLEPEKCYIRMQVRKSGYQRAIVDEHSRIKELYKLEDHEVVGAMLGVDSVIPNWRAPALESSDYVTMMGTAAREVDRDLVQTAYGYNAISKLLCDTPSFTRPFSGQQLIDVPYGLQTRAVGYEYDVDGKLLGWFSHSAGSKYVARDIRTKLVELVAGAADDRLDEVYGEAETVLDPKANYRMYVCPMVSGIPSNDWQDVTGSGMYGIINNKLTWTIDRTQFYTLVRSDKIMYAKNLSLTANDGELRFSLVQRALRNNAIGNYVMQIPLGELDVWLNERALIEGLDYVMHFPEITITNKQYLENPATQAQRIAIRFSGFCKADFSREIPADKGFIEYGLLSHNNRFDIRDDKVMRIVVDGKLYHRSELDFAEDDAGVTVPDAKNGAPYLIRDLVVPMRGMTIGSTYELRDRSRELDSQISDYMTLKHPEPAKTTPSAIPDRHVLLSPFLCKLFYDLKEKVLDDPRLYQHYNDMDVLDICKPYEYLLKYDPAREENEVDERYVIIHAHNMPGVEDIDIYYLQFLTRVNKLYLRNKVQMAHLFRLAA